MYSFRICIWNKLNTYNSYNDLLLPSQCAQYVYIVTLCVVHKYEFSIMTLHACDHEYA